MGAAWRAGIVAGAALATLGGAARGQACGPGSVLDALAGADRVLWLGAHPDDENSSGGFVARAKDVAGQLFMATLTRGENSDRVWDGLCRGSQIGRARAELFAESAAYYMADGYDIGPFVNGPHSLAELDAQCPPGAPFEPWPASATPADVRAKWTADAGDPVAWIVSLLRARRPDVVIAMDEFCGVSGHIEHRALAGMLLEAIPAAADPNRYPDSGPAWCVGRVVFSAHLIDALADCGLCKCAGPAPMEPVDPVLALEPSATHGHTYYWVACLAKTNYATTMNGLDWTDAMIRAYCTSDEAAALGAYAAGSRAYPIVEPYRVRSPSLHAPTRSLLRWTASGSAYDLIRGDLGALRSSGGAFDMALETCLADDWPDEEFLDAASPAGRAGWWYLVRAGACAGTESYDTGAASQRGCRDPELGGAANACP
ncbi:MAG: hypothetical protein D6718_06585 [Acidobacteria bacterium]|nr:MAG: hypothetical protein D6718_06585 [Acidobacteriota bacterium]